jgi:SAM-dependent methyltransferase
VSVRAADWQDELSRFPTEAVPNCMLCGCVVVSRDPRWESLLALRAPYAVLHCDACSLRWLSPRPSAAGYQALYSNRNYFGGVGAVPEDYSRVVAERRDAFSRRLLRIERHCGSGRPLKLLDYGAAFGDFVELARARGHHCDGIELSDDARGMALREHGIELMSPGQEDTIAAGIYDVLHMNHVLEHMPDPLAHLRRCGHWLRPGGLLVVEVPQQFDNLLDRTRRLLSVGGRQREFNAYSLHHTYFFSPRSLREVARRSGLEEVSLRTFNPDKTPLWPPRAKNWVLAAGLAFADLSHAGGNILELYATRAAGGH